MKISILGSGWLSLPLARTLTQRHHDVSVSTTRESKIAILEQQDFKADVMELSPGGVIGSLDFFQSEILLVVIPPAERRGYFSASIRALTDRLQTLEHQPNILFISSTSVFAPNQGVVTESARPAAIKGRGAELIAAEQLVMAPHTTILRLGGLVGPDRHPGHFLAGQQNLERGDAPVNLIEVQDAIALTCAVVEQNQWGEVFHGVCDEHRSRQEFYTHAARAAQVEPPTFVPIPSERPTLIVNTKVKRRLGYQFTSPTLEHFTRA